MAWYRTGTVSVTNGSATVTGSGTSWIEGAAAGEGFYGPDGRLYEISAIVSATQLTLGSVYLGSTVTGQAYQIVPSQSYIRSLAAQAAALVNDYAGVLSTVGVGKFSDGTVSAPGIRFSSDENTGIRRVGADNLALVTGGADRLSVTSSAVAITGNLSVSGSITGTTTLASAVLTTADINGGTIDNTAIGGATPAAGSFTTLSASGAVTLSGGTANGVLYLDGSKVATSGSALTYNGTGLGVGVASAAFALDVGGSDGTNIALRSTGTTAARFRAYVNGAESGVIGFLNGGGQLFEVAGSEQMRLTSTGLGIGTSSPDTKLTVTVADAATSTRFKAATGTVRFRPYVDATNGAIIDATNAAESAYLPLTLIGSTLRLLGNNGTGAVVDSSGNLGIGTSSPGAKLHVSNGSGTDSGLFTGLVIGGLDATSARTASLIKNTSTPYDLIIRNQNFTGATSGSLIFQNGSTEQMRLDSSGNLGIGTSSPGGKLDVATTTPFTFDTTSTAGVKIGTQGTVGGSFMVQTQSASAGFGSGLAIDGTYAGAPPSAISTVNIKAFGVYSGGGYFSNLAFWTSSGTTLSQKMLLDSSGNLGLGVTPSAWATGAKAFQFDSYSALFESVVGRTTLAFNARESASGSYSYLQPEYATMYQQVSGVHSWYTAPSGTAGNAISFTQAMTLDASGNLGVGTSSPAQKLVVSNAGAAGFEFDPANGIIQTYNRSSSAYIDMRQYALNIRFFTGSSPTETMRLDSSGNLGLGVTPSAWDTATFRTLQVGVGVGSVSLSGRTDGGKDLVLGSNIYFGTGSWRYVGAGVATSYRQDSGQHSWYTAPSGTAGNAISFTQAMTLDASGNLGIGVTSPSTRLDLESSGSRVIDINSTNVAGSGIRFNNSSTINGYVGSAKYIVSGGALADFGIDVSGANNLIFGTNDTERARITSGGKLLVGTTTAGYGLFTEQRVTINPTNDGIVVAPLAENLSAYTVQANSDTGTRYAMYIANGSSTAVGTISFTSVATAYNTTSDYRLKNNPQPLTGSGAFIDALQPKTWNWKADGSRGVGFIAHEAQAVSPSSVVGEKDAVDADGKPVMQAMEYGSAEFITNIIAELQSLRARVAALENN